MKCGPTGNFTEEMRIERLKKISENIKSLEKFWRKENIKYFICLCSFWFLFSAFLYGSLLLLISLIPKSFISCLLSCL